MRWWRCLLYIRPWHPAKWHWVQNSETLKYWNTSDLSFSLQNTDLAFIFLTLLCPSQQQPPASQEKFYSMAAQIKLLLEIPEKIWSSMEASQYLHATQLYLLCCHLHSLLQLDASSSQYSPILSRFPILIRQVAAASHFRWVDATGRSPVIARPSSLQFYGICLLSQYTRALHPRC